MTENNLDGYEPTGEYREPKEGEPFLSGSGVRSLSSIVFPNHGTAGTWGDRAIYRKKTHQHVYTCECGKEPCE